MLDRSNHFLAIPEDFVFEKEDFTEEETGV